LPVPADVSLAAALDTFGDGILGGRLDFTLVARSLDFHFNIRCAVVAEAFGGIPTAVADIGLAFSATVEVVLGILYGLGEGLVPCWPKPGLGQAVYGRADATENAPKHAARLAEPARRLAAGKSDELRAPGVGTPFAKEIELETGVGSVLDTEIVEILAELDFRHGIPLGMDKDYSVE
jgi:hypothetical protein